MPTGPERGSPWNGQNLQIEKCLHERNCRGREKRAKRPLSQTMKKQLLPRIATKLAPNLLKAFPNLATMDPKVAAATLGSMLGQFGCVLGRFGTSFLANLCFFVCCRSWPSGRVARISVFLTASTSEIWRQLGSQRASRSRKWISFYTNELWRQHGIHFLPFSDPPQRVPRLRRWTIFDTNEIWMQS